MKVAIIGSGRIGLSLGAVLADAGCFVLMTDKEDKKKELSGELSFYEVQLDKYLEKNQKNLEWTRWTEKIISADIIFFCLSFPVKKEGDLDLTELFNWVQCICEYSKEDKILVIKSTVPIGTNKKIQDIIKKKNITALSCPEFLREGQAVQDLLHPQRVVIGSNNRKSAKKLEELYKKFSQAKQIIHTDPETAELSKLACNSFLAAKISFINEMAGLCEKVKANIEKLQLILGSDSRIGKDFLNPGLGYGGYCLPKDVQLTVSEAQKRNQNMELLKSAQKINSDMVNHFYQKIKSHYKKLKGVELAFWGISFKKETDNLKNSPALKLIYKLLKSGVQAHVYDPLFVEERVFKIFKGYKYSDGKKIISDRTFNSLSSKKEMDYLVKKIFKGQCFFYKNILESIKNKQGLIIGSDWDEFKQTPLSQIKQKLANSVIIDGRSLFLTEDLTKNKISFYKKGQFF